MKKIILASLFLLLPGLALQAEENFCGAKEPHPIDVWRAKAMKDKVSTIAMREVQAEAYQKWDAQLNQDYQKLLKSLKPQEQVFLRKAQRKWLGFFESENQLLSDVIYHGGGSLAPLILSDAATEMIKRRTCQLKQHWKAKQEGF